jgi:magnesium transporter
VVYRDLEKAVSRYRAPDLDLYFDDITDASERIWDVLENYKEQIESLESTNESVISHRVNDVLRVLTIFSVLILPLTFVASMWGMNVPVPFGDWEHGFEILVAVMIGVLVLTLVAFRRLRLL